MGSKIKYCFLINKTFWQYFLFFYHSLNISLIDLPEITKCHSPNKK